MAALPSGWTMTSISFFLESWVENRPSAPASKMVTRSWSPTPITTLRAAPPIPKRRFNMPTEKLGNRARAFRIHIDDFKDGRVRTVDVGDRLASLRIDIGCQRTGTGNRFAARQTRTYDGNNNNAFQMGTPDRDRFSFG